MTIQEILQKPDDFKYQLLDRMKSDCLYYLGNGNRNNIHLWCVGNEEKHIDYMKELWNSFPTDKKPEWLTYNDITNFERQMLPERFQMDPSIPEAVLVEIDDKGSYGRFAVTLDDFADLFEDFPGIPAPSKSSETYTLRPLVHVWYELTPVDSEMWTTFFTDMTWGLSDNDIDNDNLAYILEEEISPSLKEYLPKPLIEQAYSVVSDILSKEKSTELLEMANVIYQLKRGNNLSKPEILHLAQKTVDGSQNSTIPLLTDERIDAVKTLLAYGMENHRSPEFPEASSSDMKELLLNCDLDIFTEIVDSVAIDNIRFYLPDRDYSKYGNEMLTKAINAIQAITQKEIPVKDYTELIFTDISNQLKSAKNTTAYGEPQAFYCLKNGRSIEATLEMEGLHKNEYFYSVRLCCSEYEYDNHMYNSTNGVITQFNTSDADLTEVKNLITSVLECDRGYPAIDKTNTKSNPESLGSLLSYAKRKTAKSDSFESNVKNEKEI